MSEVKNIKVSSIDPQSRVNVRRTAVEANIERVKSSIEQHGYWSEQPIAIRPHPDPSSGYQYEYIIGQCRLKACLELGLEEIPAIVAELDDDEAIQRSWLENEKRGELTTSDRSYWVQRIYKKYAGSGHTEKEALDLAAKYLGVTPQTAMNYYGLVVLPGDLKEKVDQGILPQGHALAIAKNTVDFRNLENSQDKMRERAEWFSSLERDHRRYFPDVLEKLSSDTSVKDLDKELERIISEKERTLEVTVPGELWEDLLRWGEERGLKDIKTIVSHMMADTLRRMSR